MRVLLCLTKSDLAPADDLIGLYEPLGVDIVVTGQEADGTITQLDQVQDALRGRISVLVGHSGVGKSTLVNALVPEADRSIGVVNVVTGRGRHTSTSAVALRLPQRTGWVIDTPGVRSFGLAHIEPDGILAAFEDLAEVASQCPRGCTHLGDAPDCNLDEWVRTDPAQQEFRAARINSFRRLLTARSQTDTVAQ